MRVPILSVLVALLLSGCVSSPLSQLETATPTLSRSQVADLQKRNKTPVELGIEVRRGARGVELGGVNEVAAAENVTVPLLKLPTQNPGAAGGQFRVPVVLGRVNPDKRVGVNGNESVQVLLDSGSNLNLFGYSLARSLGIPTIAGVEPIHSMGIGGAVDNYAALVPSMQIGALEFRKMLALIGADVQALSFARGFWSDKQLMILGMRSLRSLSYVSIDNLHGTVTFAPREVFRPSHEARAVTSTQLRWVGDLPVIDVSVDSRRPIACVVDTGGDYGLLVPRSTAQTLGYWKPGQGQLTTSRGVGGASLETRFEVRQVRIGDATFVQVPARSALAGPELAGGQILLGNVVLRRHRVTFDFRNGLLWLER